MRIIIALLLTFACAGVVTAQEDLTINRIFLGTPGAHVTAGSGAPEGVVTAPVGSVYLRSDTGVVYRKTSGTGANGWTSVTAVAEGGTGRTIFSAGDLLYASAPSVINTISATEGGKVLASAGAGAAPVYTPSPSLTSIGSAGTLTLNPTDDLILQPAVNVILDPTSNFVLPQNSYDVSLGMLTKKFLSLHAAELWVETLVAQDTIATIGGRILVGPTTTLVNDVLTTSQSIVVKHNQMAAFDIVYLEAGGQVEFMRIESLDGGSAGAYTYTVTRNIDGGDLNSWAAGDAVFNTGVTGEGFIDLYSVRGVRSASEIGPTIVGNVRTGEGFNAWAPRWAIGNLNGLYGMGAVYGTAFGDPAAANIVIDATNGIRIRNVTTNLLHADASGNLYLGQPGGNYLSWDGTNLTLVSQHLTINSAGVAVSPSTVLDASRAYRFTNPSNDGGLYGIFGLTQVTGGTLSDKRLAIVASNQNSSTSTDEAQVVVTAATTTVSSQILLMGTATPSAGFTVTDGVNGTALTVSPTRVRTTNIETLGGLTPCNNNIATILYTIPTGALHYASRWEIVATVYASGLSLTSFATVVSDGANLRIAANNGANLTLSLSGANVQVTQTSGANQQCGWSVLRIGSAP